MNTGRYFFAQKGDKYIADNNTEKTACAGELSVRVLTGGLCKTEKLSLFTL